MEFRISKSLIRIVKGDITEQGVDAIVNAANRTLMGGGGVDGAIHRKGGPRILEQCKRIRETEWPDGLPTGKAVTTSGGDLKAKFVIHTVGPVWRGGDRGEPELLAQAYKSSLRQAISRSLRSIAFPSISTGAYGYPVELASQVAMKTVRDFVKVEGKPEEIVFVVFSEADMEIYKVTANEMLKISTQDSKCQSI